MTQQLRLVDLETPVLTPPAQGPGSFLDDVLRGLAQTPKRLPSKYFYDEAGARLFESICELPSYYLTRTELSICKTYGPDIAEWIGVCPRIVELGSGSDRKIRALMRHLLEPVSYVPVDISKENLHASVRRLQQDFPGLEVQPVHTDYTVSLELPHSRNFGMRTVVLFLGSSLGNFNRDEAVAFLARIRQVIGARGGVLLGLDLRKNPSVISEAYNDPQGVTARFNQNMLRRINKELSGTFPVETFHHHAYYEPGPGRIVMTLVSSRRQDVRVSGTPIHFEEGEPIVTEYSYKYSPAELGELAKSAGLHLCRIWTDDDRLFSLSYLSV